MRIITEKHIFWHTWMSWTIRTPLRKCSAACAVEQGAAVVLLLVPRSINTPYSGLSATKTVISPAISNVMTVGLSAMRQLLQLCAHEPLIDTPKKMCCGLEIKDPVMETQETSADLKLFCILNFQKCKIVSSYSLLWFTVSFRLSYSQRLLLFLAKKAVKNYNFVEYYCNFKRTC